MEVKRKEEIERKDQTTTITMQEEHLRTRKAIKGKVEKVEISNNSRFSSKLHL